MWRVPVYILHWSLRPGQRQLLLWSHWGKDTGEVCAINKCYNKFTSNSRENKCLLVFFLSFETQSTVGKTLAWKMLDKKSVTLKDHIKFCTYAVEETQCDILNFWKILKSLIKAATSHFWATREKGFAENMFLYYGLYQTSILQQCNEANFRAIIGFRFCRSEL